MNTEAVPPKTSWSSGHNLDRLFGSAGLGSAPRPYKLWARRSDQFLHTDASEIEAHFWISRRTKMFRRVVIGALRTVELVLPRARFRKELSVRAVRYRFRPLAKPGEVQSRAIGDWISSSRLVTVSMWGRTICVCASTYEQGSSFSWR